MVFVLNYVLFHALVQNNACVYMCAVVFAGTADRLGDTVYSNDPVCGGCNAWI